MQQIVHLTVFLFCLISSHITLQAEEPIQALLVTGGCCHDYDQQKLILTKGISARANVVWTVVQQGGNTTNAKIPLYEDPNWADGFDIVVHNECFADVPDRAWVERILEPHRSGTPAILIHCAMHCYRTGTDDWFEFAGVESPVHGPHYPYIVENINPSHPIMKGFGESWQNPQGELYHTIKLWPTATPLAQAKRQSDGELQTCVWTNDYHGTRVFGTTIGHYNATMADPRYLDMLTRGLLWAVGSTNPNAITPTTKEFDNSIRELAAVKPSGAAKPVGPCCGEGNLAFGNNSSAKSTQSGNDHKNAVDGDLHTRWCADGAQANEWWQVEFNRPEHVRSLRIHWEKENTAYRYTVEASPDGQAWKTLVDKSGNRQNGQIVSHKVDAPHVKFLRVNFLGSSTGVWGSFWEFEAYTGDLPELPESSQGSNATVADVSAVPEFNVTLFSTPPEVNYPVCLTAASTGEVFVGVDEQGSLGKDPGRGKVLRCIDTDGDGHADKINVFAKMDHPRGLIYDQGSLWVLHPPYLTLYQDSDGDGTADREERLISGISTDQVEQRGADHTTNGIRMGIDGWIYIAVGDFGFTNAVGADGTTLSRRGGGIVRVRPDGTEMEIYCWGLRNILDVCIDPYMNLFTRDNTNDGGEWNVRLSHILQSAEYGYPSLFLNFTDEIMPPLADYGGGSGCGAFYLHDLRWPEKYRNTLFTCDWGRSEVYFHNLPANGPTFDAHQDVFAKIPRPTDIDIDGSGRMYISSWKNGNFAYEGPDVGFVAQVLPDGFVPKPLPHLPTLSDSELVNLLSAPGMKQRLHAQRELIRRGDIDSGMSLIKKLILAADTPTYARVAGIYTLKQVLGTQSHETLWKATDDPELRPFALRALTDRKSQLHDLSSEQFVKYLSDEDPRVVAQATISFGRLGRAQGAEALLPLTVRQNAVTPVTAHNAADPDRVIPHLAIRALVAVNAGEACLNALDTPYREGALQALRSMHAEPVVSGLIERLGQTEDDGEKAELLSVLTRLYYREGEYTSGWWGTRPDRTGPYFDRQKWEQSDRIEPVLVAAYNSADEFLKEKILNDLRRHRVQPAAFPKSLFEQVDDQEPTQPIVVPTVDPNNPNQIANMTIAEAKERAMKTPGDVKLGRKLFLQQSCVACHTYGTGQAPKGPHLADIGKRYKRVELIDSILTPSVKIAQGFDTYSVVTTKGKVYSGFIATQSAEEIVLRQATGLSETILTSEIEEQIRKEQSMMPQGIVNNLTPEELANLLAFLEQLK